jgi:hypothetical protein
MVFSELKEPALNVATAALDQPGGEGPAYDRGSAILQRSKREIGVGTSFSFPLKGEGRDGGQPQTPQGDGGP